MNRVDEVSQAVEDARDLQRAVDANAGKMARMIAGRLRSSDISGSVLEQLKRELGDFNIQTHRWKD